jgi:hypothetical protein
MRDLWWTKWHWGKFTPSTSVFLTNHYSTKFSILIITRGKYNMRIAGLRAEWTQLDSNPHFSNKKNYGDAYNPIFDVVLNYELRQRNYKTSQPAVPRQAPPRKHLHCQTAHSMQFSSQYNGIQSNLIISPPCPTPFLMHL